MGNNNLYKIENTLRSMAKRYKSVKYTLGLAILFLMMGVSAFSEEVVAQQEVMTTEQIAASKDNLKDSIGNLQSKIDAAKKENEKSLAGLRLELIQLMEQGNQVVKSPWMSWQFGANYIYNQWNGTYKGKGDKAQKYPFEGVFERDANLFNRYMPTTSENYSLLSTSSNPRSAASNARQGLPNYGLASNVPVLEPPVETEVNAGINPKSINKVPLNIAAKTANSPTLPEAVKFAPIDPTIVIPADPALPAPPSFKVVVGADCNSGDGTSCGSGSRVLTGTPGTDGYEFLQYTWQSSNEAQGLAFKWFDAVTSGNKIYGDGTAFGAAANVTIGTDNFAGTSRTSGTTISINSYNGLTGLASSTNTSPVDRNKQYFLVGGSRAIEADM